MLNNKYNQVTVVHCLIQTGGEYVRRRKKIFGNCRFEKGIW